MADHDDRSALLWDAVLGDAPWSEALGRISETTAGAKTFLILWRIGAMPDLWSDRFDPSLLPHDYFGPENPFFGFFGATADGAVYDRRAIISDAGYARHRLMRPMREQDVVHGLLAKLSGTATASAGLWIGLPAHRGDECLALHDAFASWIRPLQRALRARDALADGGWTTGPLLDAIDRLRTGVVIVDADLKILQCNALAERILAAGDGLCCRLGRLTIGAGSGHRALQRRLHALWSAPGSAPRDPLAVARPSRLPDYRLDVVPARGARTAAAVLIADPVDERALPATRALEDRFGLTPGEARVARLVPLGLTKRQIADRLGISENTVKSHLLAVRAKLDVRNMVELAATLQSGCGPPV